jgi:hypothetical protein
MWMHCLRIRVLVVAVVQIVCVKAIFSPGVDTTVAAVPPFYPNGRDRSHNYKIVNDERVYDVVLSNDLVVIFLLMILLPTYSNLTSSTCPKRTGQ